jgi:hypothetical protein
MVFNEIPDLCVKEDLIKHDFDNRKQSKIKNDEHLFSFFNSYLRPYPFAKEQTDKNEITLYSGGMGGGNYMEIIFSKSEKKYIYQNFMDVDKEKNIMFSSEKWNEVYDYVKKELTTILEYWDSIDDLNNKKKINK